MKKLSKKEVDKMIKAGTYELKYDYKKRKWVKP